MLCRWKNATHTEICNSVHYYFVRHINVHSSRFHRKQIFYNKRSLIIMRFISDHEFYGNVS